MGDTYQHTGFFDTFRIHGGPTLYPSNKTPVTVDVVEWGFAFAIIIIIVSFFIILPGFRGNERWYFFTRAAIGCFVLVSIMVCNFGQEWEKAEVHNIRTYYKAGFSKEIENATIEVKIGLRSVNITLKTDPVLYRITEKMIEEINYNERFHWNDMGWVQGRGGFGPPATLFNRDYRRAQLRGSPFPILWIAEYFTIDGEGIRWGRYYRQAGYFTHCLLWLALPLWIITIILFKVVLEYGAYFSMATGATLLLGNVIYATVRNPLNLQIHIGDDVLSFAWGWTFWLNLVNGLIALFIGIVVWFMNLRFTEAIFTFFGVDILNDIEEYYASIEELRTMGIHIAKPVGTKGHPNVGFDTDPGDVVINAQEKDVELYDNVEGITRGFRRKNQGTFAKRFDRSVKVKSRKDSRVDLAASHLFFRGGQSNFHSPTPQGPLEGLAPHLEFSFRGGILPSYVLPPATGPPKRKGILRHRGGGEKRRVVEHNNRLPRENWTPLSNSGQIPFHSHGNIPVSYHSRRYSGDGSLNSVDGYNSWGVIASDSMIYPQGSRWRPPGSLTNSNGSNMNNGYPDNQQLCISNPNYPYKTHSSSSESTPSFTDIQEEIKWLFAKRNGVKKSSARGKRR